MSTPDSYLVILYGEGPSFHHRISRAVWQPCIWAHLGAYDRVELGGRDHPERLVAAPSFPVGFFKLKTVSGRFLAVSFLFLALGSSISPTQNSCI